MSTRRRQEQPQRTNVSISRPHSATYYEVVADVEEKDHDVAEARRSDAVMKYHRSSSSVGGYHAPGRRKGSLPPSQLGKKDNQGKF